MRLIKFGMVVNTIIEVIKMGKIEKYMNEKYFKGYDGKIYAVCKYSVDYVCKHPKHSNGFVVYCSGVNTAACPLIKKPNKVVYG